MLSTVPVPSIITSATLSANTATLTPIPAITITTPTAIPEKTTSGASTAAP